MAKKDIEEEDGHTGSDVVRQTIVLPGSLHRIIKAGADEEKMLIGEHVRDILRDYVDIHENLVECEGKDCEYLVDSRWNYCPHCGTEVPEYEDDDDESDDDEESEESE